MRDDLDIEKVIPEIEWQPKRKYERKGSVITCWEVDTADISVLKPAITYKDNPLFTLNLDNEEHAKAIMNDFYYGEYTGA